MKRQIIPSELYRDEVSELDLESLELRIGWIKATKPDFFNIRMVPEADYDGYITSITFVGDRFETDAEKSKREEIGRKISEAWDKHDKKKLANK